MHLAVVVLVALSCPQSRKLSGALAKAGFQGGGNVTSVQLSPDGAWAVYRVDAETDGLFELYSVPPDGSASLRKLSDGDNVENGLISVGGLHVAYGARGGGAVELFAVPVDGSASPTRLNATLPAGADGIELLRLTPDGSLAVYVADEVVQDRFELWSVPIDASSPPVRLNGTLVSGGDVDRFREFAITPAGSHVVYLADEDVDNRTELYSAPLPGGTSVRLNTPLAVNGMRVQRGFNVSPDSTSVVYISDEASVGTGDLYSVPVDGSAAPVKLNPTLVSGGDVSYVSNVSPLGDRVLYIADQITDDQHEVFSVPIDGSSSAVKLNPPLLARGDVMNALFSPDGSCALIQLNAWRSAGGIPTLVQLWVVPIDGSSPAVKLTPVLPPGGRSSVGSAGAAFRFSNGGQRVVYLGDQETNDVFELFSVPIDGSSPSTKLSGTLVPGGDVSIDDWILTPDGTTALFVADKVLDERFELWSVPADGTGPAIAISGVLDEEEDVAGALAQQIAVHPDSQLVAYMADSVLEGQNGLLSVPVAGGGAPIDLSGSLVGPPVVGDVLAYEWSPDGERAVFLADGDMDEVHELYSASISSPDPRVKLSAPAPFVVSFGAVPFTFSNLPILFDDSGRLVFQSDIGLTGPNDAGNYDLFSAPVDGGIGALQIDDGLGHALRGTPRPLPGGLLVYERTVCCAGTPGPREIWLTSMDGSTGAQQLTFGGPVGGWKPTPGGDQILVTYLGGSGSPNSLWTVMVDGSGETQIASGLYQAGTSQFTPSGDRILVETAFSAGGPVELWSFPLSGGAPLRLNPALGAERDVRSFFDITPDGSRVVYCADQDTDEVFELYSVPLTGGSSVKLSGAMVLGGDVIPFYEFSFDLSPDGSTVVYLADQLTDGQLELFAAPVDGSSAAVRLNAPLTVPSHIEDGSFRFHPNGQSIVYASDQDTPGAVELFLVPLDGSQAPLKLNAPMVTGGSLQSVFNRHRDYFAFDRKGRWLYYMADQEVDDRVELFAVPSDGSGPVRKLSGPLVENGNVASFRIGNGLRVLYSADQEQDEVFELFLSAPPPTERSGARAVGAPRGSASTNL